MTIGFGRIVPADGTTAEVTSVTIVVGVVVVVVIVVVVFFWCTETTLKQIVGENLQPITVNEVVEGKRRW